MNELQKLYDVLSRDGYYTNSFEEFQVKFQDADYQKKVYDTVSRDGLYTNDMAEFMAKYVSGVQAPVVKKKEETATESVSELGSLALPEPEVPVETAIAPAPEPEVIDVTGAPDPDFFEERMEMVSPELIDRGDENQVAEELTDVFKPYGFDVQPTGIGDALKVTAANGQTIDVNLDPWELPGFLAGSISDVFESGKRAKEKGLGFGEARRGEDGDSSFQAFMGGEYDSKTEKSEAEKLKKFLRENKDESQDIARKNASYTEPEKVFVTPEQREAEVKRINRSHKEVNRLSQDYIKSEKDFIDKYPQFQTYDPEYIKNNPEEYQMFLADRNILEGDKEFLGQTHENTKEQGAQLDRLAGEYTEMLAKRGYWSGGVFYNELVSGAASIASGSFDFGLYTGYNPDFLMETDPEFFKDEYLKEASDRGYDVPSASDMTVDEFKSWMKTDKGIPAKESTAIQNQIVDTKLKKRKDGEPIDYEEAVNAYSQYATSKNMEVTGGELDALRRGLDFLKDSESTPEAADLMYESFWGGALLGVTRSLPAMLFPGGWAGRTAAMYSQITDFLEKEMSEDPDFQNISEAEKFRLKMAIGSVSSVLEAVGLRNVLKQKGLLTGLLMRVLKKTPANVKGKAFNEVVMREVNSAIGRGALVVTSAGLAEFETGFFQEGWDVGVKGVYNEMKDKEMFETPEGAGDIFGQMLYAGAQEAVGGFVLGTPGAISAARGSYDFTAIDDATFEMFQNVSKQTAVGELTYRNMFYTNQQARINRGEISKEDAQAEMDKLDEVISVNRDIPSDLTIAQQKKALGIQLRRKDLKDQIEGKDPIFVKRQQEEINRLSRELDQILYETTEDAIQESSTESVDVQEPTDGGPAVGEGIPDAGTATQEVAPEDQDADQSPEAPTTEGGVTAEERMDIDEFFGEDVSDDVDKVSDNLSINRKQLTDADEYTERVERKVKRVKEISNRASIALRKVAPDVKIVLHETPQQYNRFAKSGSRGQYKFEDKTIHINLTLSDLSTVPHEVFHALLLEKALDDPNAVIISRKMLESVRKTIDPTSDLAKKIDKFVSLYGDQPLVQDEEYLAELTGILTSEYRTLSKPAKSAIKDFIRKLAKMVGLEKFVGPEFLKTDEEVIDLLNTISRKIAEGDYIETEEVAVLDKIKKSTTAKERLDAETAVEQALDEQDAIKAAANSRQQIVGERANLEEDVRDGLDMAQWTYIEQGDSKEVRREVKAAWGWEKGADGKWKYEIPYGKLKDVENGEYKLGDIYDAPELYKAYPDVANVSVSLNYGVTLGKMRGDENAGAGISLDGNSIVINSPTFDEAKKDLMHELQHYVQFKEGFAIGGNMFTAEKLIEERFTENERLKYKELKTEEAALNAILYLEEEIDESIENGLSIYEFFEASNIYDIIKDDSSLLGRAFKASTEAIVESAKDPESEYLGLSQTSDENGLVAEIISRTFDKYSEDILSEDDTFEAYGVEEVMSRVLEEYLPWTPFVLYNRLAGEVEARVAGESSDFSQDGKRNKRLFEDRATDFPISEQVVYFDEQEKVLRKIEAKEEMTEQELDALDLAKLPVQKGDGLGKGISYGPRATLANYESAKTMYADGVSAEDIEILTGWDVVEKKGGDVVYSLSRNEVASNESINNAIASRKDRGVSTRQQKVQKLAQMYNMNDQGFMPSTTQLDQVRKAFAPFGLGVRKGRDDGYGRGGGVYLTRNGRKYNPFKDVAPRQQVQDKLKARSQAASDFTDEQLTAFAKEGILFHGSDMQKEFFDSRFIKEFNYGYGFYFTGLPGLARQYGDKLSFVDTQEFNLLDGDESITRGQAQDMLNNLPGYGLNSEFVEEFLQDYIDDEGFENDPQSWSMFITEYISDYQSKGEIFSEYLESELGFDGMTTIENDIKRNVPTVAVLWNFDLLNDNVLQDPTKENVVVEEAPKKVTRKEEAAKDVLDFVSLVASRQQVGGVDPKDVRMRSRSGSRVGKGLGVRKVNNEPVVEEIPDLTLDYVRENAPASYLKNANLIAQYPLVRGIKNFDEVSSLEQADEVYEVYARQVADNLNWIMESYPEEYREISTLWYDGANKIANELAADYGVSPEQVAGIIASLSPQNDWYQNVRAAELSLLAFRENPVMSQKMIDYQVNYAEGKINKLRERIESASEAKGKSQAKAKVAKFKAVESKNLKSIADAEALLDLLRSYKGKLMEDAPDALKPYYVRLYSEVNQPKSYPIISPDGNYGSDALTDAGGKRKFGWGSYAEIGKGVSIRLDGSQENISVTLGQMHKIRNFFNNIIDPMSKENDITMDTHAIAAALLIPASSKTKEVVQNFGTGTANSGVKGQKGLYYANQAGYFLSAEENNMLPRQVQSVTWEAVRGLFTSKFKDGAKNVKSINDIWENYAEGNITIEQARQEVLEKADGINAPSWAGLISDESRDGDGTTTERGRGKRGGPATEREGVAPRQQVVYRGGDLTTKAEERLQQDGSRGTGHFGTGFYFFSDKERAESYANKTGRKGQLSEIDLSPYHLAEASENLHDALKISNIKAARGGGVPTYGGGKGTYHTITPEEIQFVSVANSLANRNENIRFGIPWDEKSKDTLTRHPELMMPKADAARIAAEATRLYNESGNTDSASTSVMKALGFEGVNAVGTRMDNSTYGTVIYDLKEDIAPRQQVADIDKKISNLKAKRAKLTEAEYKRDEAGKPSYSKEFFSKDEKFSKEIERLRLLKLGLAPAYEQRVKISEELDELNKPFEREVGNKYYPRLGTVSKGEMTSEDSDLAGIYEAEVDGYLFRGVSVEDYNRIKKEGFIDTDLRGAISDKEGINLTPYSSTAFNYLPEGVEGVVMAIKVSDKSGLFMIGADDYVRSSKPIPFTDVEFVTTPVIEGRYLPVKDGKSTPIAIKKVAHPSEKKTSDVAPRQQKAPNGRPSNLNEEQYKIVRTPAFKKWFGDWEADPKNASKVVDENGEPMVMYHGTSLSAKADIAINGFDSYKGRNGLRGFSFMSEKGLTKAYDKGAVLDVFLNLKNPMDFEKNFEIRGEIIKKVSGKDIKEMTTPDWLEYTGEISRLFEKEAIRLGYDGVFDVQQPESKVFKNTNIKTADGSNTTFDATSPSTRQQLVYHVTFSENADGIKRNGLMKGRPGTFSRKTGGKFDTAGKTYAFLDLDDAMAWAEKTKDDSGSPVSIVAVKKGDKVFKKDDQVFLESAVFTEDAIEKEDIALVENLNATSFMFYTPKKKPDVASRQQLSDIATPLPRQQKSVREVVQQARDNNFKDAATKDFLKRKGVPTADIDKAIKTLDDVYARVMKEIDGVITKSQKRGVDFDTQLKNALAYLQGTKLYEDTTDIHREKLIREVRAKFDKKEKRAPSAKRILGKIKDVKKVTLTEKEALKMQLRTIARTAKSTAKALVTASNELTKSLKDMVKVGVINTNQMYSVLRKFSRVDMFNPASIDSFIDYMSNIFADAEYGEKIAKIKKLLPRAKKNIKSKIGTADILGGILTRLLNVNPLLVPMDVLEDYRQLVEMVGSAKKVLTLSDIKDVTAMANKVLSAVYEEVSMAEDLTEVFFNYANKVIKDGNLEYAATIDAMLADDTISPEEAAVMRKYKSRIVEPTKKEPKTEEQIAEDREELMSSLDEAKVNVSRLAMDEEKVLARQLANLMRTEAIEKLSNQQIETLLAVIENINNGYVTHAAQRLVESMNAFNRAEDLSDSVSKAKPLPLSTFIGRIKSSITKNNKFFEAVKRNPLAYIDQVFGDYKTTRIYDAIFKPLSQAYDTMNLDIQKIEERLENVQRAVSKSFKNDPNKSRISSYKMMTYMLQREFEANPDNRQVNPAADFIKSTIDHINKGQSFFKAKDADMLQQILDDFGGEQIDSQKLYDSFNKSERNALAVMEDINKSMGSKAVFTGAVIRGNRIDALNQYAHHNVLSTSGNMDKSADVSIIEAYNQSMRASTKAKTLIERTGAATPLNFDVFTSVSRGSRFVLTDFYLTEPIRTSRKTISDTRKVLEERGDMTKQENEIVNAIENSLELTLDNLLTSTFSQSTFFENAVQYAKKTGYRLVLASLPRAIAEYTSNVAFGVIYAPKDLAKGMSNKKVVVSLGGMDIMSNLKSTQISRMYPNEVLSGRMIDTSILGEKLGDKGGRAYGDVLNKMTQIYNRLVKPVKGAVELVADGLISSPDKAIIRPMWFGSFENAFQELTKKTPDFDKIAANDESYMSSNKEALDKATEVADQTTTLIGAADNPFKSILKGKYPSKAKLSALLQGFNNFNSFMTRFLIYEYISARTAVNAMMGNGMISKRQGAALLGAVTTRMVTYTLMGTLLNQIIKQALGLDDEDDEKDVIKRFGQALASTATSLIIGRDFGNVVKGLLNYGVENINEEFLDGLRDGDYDPYHDSIAYTFIPPDKEYKSNTIIDYIRNLMGPFGPFFKMAEFGFKTLSADEKKDPSSRIRQQRELNERLPLEVLGNLGLIPMYRDIRTILLSDIYKGMGKEKKGSGISDAQMKEYFPEMYEQLKGSKSLGDNDELNRIKKEQKELKKQLKESLK